VTTADMTLNANRGIILGAPGGTMDPVSGTTLTYKGIAAGPGFLGPKNNAGTLVLGGVNTYSGATIIHAGILSISADANLGTAPGSATPGSLVLSGGTLETTATFTLNANRGITLGSTGGTMDPVSGTTLTYNGIVAGTAGLGPKTLSGTLVLGGGSGNTYAGATTLFAGTLELSKTAQNAIPGALIIGNGVSTALVQETLSDQIYNSATVTVNNSGTLDLNNNNDAFFGIVMTGGTIKSGTGLITIYGNVVTNASSSTAVISGNLALSNANGPTQTFAVASGTVPNNGPDLAISASISGTGGITKTGAGTLTLSNTNTNTYTGATIVNAGTLLVNGSQSASAVTVNSGAILGGTNGTVGTISVAGGTVSPGASEFRVLAFLGGDEVGIISSYLTSS